MVGASQLSLIRSIDRSWGEAVMRCLWGMALAVVVISAASSGRACAQVVIAIDKSRQQMTVLFDGAEQHVWKVSTGLGGGPPSGTYRPERLERQWFSRKYDWSPMPHSIFFYKGYAIHGTTYVSRLGRRASHGCVRLHPKNAAILFALVRSQGMRKTTIVVADTAEALLQMLRHEAPRSAPEASAQKRAGTTAIPTADISVQITGATPDAAPRFADPQFEE
jgi:hypothetical protein